MRRPTKSGNARKGSGLLPPNPKQWENENHALNLREQLNSPFGEPLDVESAFSLLERVWVFAHGDTSMPKALADHLRTDGSARWSGLAVQFSDISMTVVIYNDSHPQTRVRATLMEEFYHLWLGHPPSKVRLYDTQGRLRTRDGAVESEAYGCGAAALVPYQPLKRLVDAGKTAREIAHQFQVSKGLVEFRAKVTKQYPRLRKG